MTRAEDAELAVEVGASYVGMIIDAPSPRLIPPERARDVASVLPGHVKAVGVVDARKELDLERILNSGVSVVQLHWATPQSFVRARELLGGYGISVAVAPLEAGAFKYSGAEYVLWDKKDWESKFLFWGIRQGISGIAGKITPENVKEIISAFKPDLIDVSSGVEREPGIKDPEKVRRVAEVVGLAL
ncbi:MAG: phosphoribosylanthranilate isomerase [Crenarchaeota archaeon]|nr:phosphoribosylanthranilate isomerase [Thermoproteota archaeon]